MAKPKRYFLDTNVLVYALDASAGGKREAAQHLIETHPTQLVVSTQVLIELYSACVTKLAKSPAEAVQVVRNAARFVVVPSDRELIIESAALSEQDGLSIFDSAIVSAAIRAECDELLTDDAKIAGADVAIPVVNPFAN